MPTNYSPPNTNKRRAAARTGGLARIAHGDPNELAAMRRRGGAARGRQLQGDSDWGRRMAEFKRLRRFGVRATDPRQLEQRIAALEAALLGTQAGAAPLQGADDIASIPAPGPHLESRSVQRLVPDENSAVRSSTLAPESASTSNGSGRATGADERPSPNLVANAVAQAEPTRLHQ